MSKRFGGATLVLVGILFSRLSGFLRLRVMAHFLGSSAAADAFNSAFRIPNLLQNLFGEGALSAALIPVYAALLASGDRARADRVAATVFALLALVSSIAVAVGIAAAPVLVYAIAPGFDPSTRDLTIHLVRILFPGTGLLVLSAWCLGILNSHHRFLVSYTAPVLANVAMIAALLLFGPGRTPDGVAEVLAFGAVVGSALQLAVQVPWVIAVAPAMRPAWDLAEPEVRRVLRAFGPTVIGRGVVQISAYMDTLLASLLPVGSVAVVGYAQNLYTLPISLFGMSVSAAELPAMSADRGRGGDVAAKLRQRLEGGLARIASLVVPSAVAFLLFGDVLAAALFQTGQFDRAASMRVWATLAGASVGMLPQTWGRLYSSASYALGDTRSPLRFAVARVVVAVVLGAVLSLGGPRIAGVDPKWGVAGLTLASGIAGWLEYRLLRRSIEQRIGPVGVPASRQGKVWAAAGLAGAIGFGLAHGIPAGLPSSLLSTPIPLATIVCGGFGVVYLAAAWLMGVAPAR